MKDSNVKRYFQLFLIILAAGSIYPMIYLRTGYSETILEVFNISSSQLNILYTVLGFVFVVGYFPSGLLTDIFSSKKLIVFSLLGTAGGGFWFSQIPNYGSVVVIFSIWGFFSVFTFWSAHMKIVQLLSTPAEEGRFFGFLDGGRGVVEALLGSAALAIFTYFLNGGEKLADKTTALSTIILMYSSVLVVVAILIAIFVTENKTQVKKANNKMKKQEVKIPFIQQMGIIFKNKLIFIMGGIVCMAYIVYWTVYYIGGYLETDIGASSVSVATVMLIVLWMRPVGGLLGGFLADKIGKTKTITLAVAGGIAGLSVLVLLPVVTAKIIFYTVTVLLGIFLYMIRGTYWSLLGDCQIDKRVLGVGIGVISFIGYIPDILLPYVSNVLSEMFTNGTVAYFIFSVLMGLIGIFLIAVFAKNTKKSKVQLNDMKVDAK